MLVGMILRFLILAAAVYLVARLVPGVRIKGFKTALTVSAIYGLLNFLFFRVLLFITFPLVILKYLTLGVFGIVINAVLLMFTDKLLDDFELSGFGAALLAAVCVSAVNVLLSVVLV
jgi:putative membrane protein